MDKLANSVGEFSCLFELVEPETGVHRKKLKDCLLKDPSSPPIYLEKDIILDILQKKSKNSKLLLSKDSLWFRGVALFQEGKKAMAFWQDADIYNANKVPEFFPSGKNMIKFIKSLFGGAGDGQQAEPEAAIEHNGFRIIPCPRNVNGGWSTEAMIEKEVNGEMKSHHFIRADTNAGKDGAVELIISKAKKPSLR